MRVIVVGGGIGGAAAALRLGQAGVDTLLYEAAPAIGGLVSSFEVQGEPLERYYHHVFPHEDRIQALIAELGLKGELEWHASSVGVFRDGRIWPFTTARDLLAFRPLDPLARIRLGAGAALRARARHTPELDDLPAVDWLERACGRAAVEVIWRPMLRAKFGPAWAEVPAAWMLGRFRQRAGARRAGRGERLGYMRGGFARLFAALEERLRALGVSVRTSTPVERIEVRDERVTGVVAGGAFEAADAVLFAGTLPLLERLLDTPLVAGHEGLGVICVVLELERRCSPVYWLNVCDEDMPFGGVIEQTNFVEADRYGGRHVVYLSRYFVQSEDVARRELDSDVVPEWLAALERVAPRVEPLAVHAFRAPYAAPLVRLGYARTIPPLTPPAPAGLVLATTAQIYPEDRGMDNGVRLAERAVRALLQERAASGAQPPARAPARPAPPRATE